jgi:hypothetical protein
MKKVLIYSKKSDAFVNNTIDWIGVDSVIRIGADMGFEVTGFKITEENKEAVLATQYAETRLDEIDSVWYNGGVVDNHNNHNSIELNVFLNQNLELITDSLLHQNDKKSIGTSFNNKESNKPYSLFVAHKNGLSVPKTLITKSKKELLDFIESAKSKTLINKRISEFGDFVENGKLYDIASTVLIDNTALDKIPDFFELSFFQEKIEREHEIRAIYFNNEFYSSAIFENDEVVDYRVNLHSSEKYPRIIPYKLPNDIEIKLRNVMKELNLSCGSIDLIYSKDNEFYFLEVNPVGQVSFISNACNYYLECLYAKYLKDEN